MVYLFFWSLYLYNVTPTVVGSSRRWRESVLFRRNVTDLTCGTFHSAVRPIQRERAGLSEGPQCGPSDDLFGVSSGQSGKRSTSRMTGTTSQPDTVTLCAAADKVVQGGKLRTRQLISLAAPCVAAVEASKVSVQPPPAIPAPSCTCSLITVPVVCSQAATMMARSCSRAAHYALRAAASPHSTRCTPARTAHARAAAGAAPDAALCSHLACSLDAVGPHDALRACCSAPACPACELIEQAHQPHYWGGPGPNFGGKQCL